MCNILMKIQIELNLNFQGLSTMDSKLLDNKELLEDTSTEPMLSWYIEPSIQTEIYFSLRLFLSLVICISFFCSQRIRWLNIKRLNVNQLDAKQLNKTVK